MAIVMFVTFPQAANAAQLPPMFFKAIRIGAPFFYAAPAVWGIVTAIGLLQLKNWARIDNRLFRSPGCLRRVRNADVDGFLSQTASGQ
jgi:hypothetical protein